MADEDERERRRRSRENRKEAASEAGESGLEAAADGCGCDIFLIAFTLLAGLPLLLWSL